MTGLLLVTRQQENHIIFQFTSLPAALSVLTLCHYFLNCPREFLCHTYKLQWLGEIISSFSLLAKKWVNQFTILSWPISSAVS